MNAPSDTTGRSAPQESEISRLYRDGARETPSAAVDDRIRAKARDAVADSTRRRRTRRWVLPVSIAAMVVLSVGVVLEMSRNDLLPLGGAVSTSETAMPSAKAPAISEEAPTDRGGGAGAAADRAREAPETSQMKQVVPQGAPRSAMSRFAAPARPDAEREPRATEEKAANAVAGPARAKKSGADVVSVKVSGSPRGYYFAVTIRSPDTGCKQYADWWEVVGEDGRLLYRRVLFHSHAQEQPFERSGGPVPIQPDSVVWVRGHMNTVGYGGVALKGSVSAGFKTASPGEGFAAALENQPPLPDGCAF